MSAENAKAIRRSDELSEAGFHAEAEWPLEIIVGEHTKDDLVAREFCQMLGDAVGKSINGGNAKAR